MAKVIILCGPGASGKDYAKVKFIELGFKPSTSYTSRPMRENESDGLTYHFRSNAKFKELIQNNFFYEYNEFGKAIEDGGPGLWLYGTPKSAFDDGCNLFIMSPSGIKKLSETHRKNSVIFYFDIAREIRLERLRKRKDLDSPERRIEVDDKDFKDFTDFDLRIYDPNFSIGELLHLYEERNGSTYRESSV